MNFILRHILVLAALCTFSNLFSQSKTNEEVKFEVLISGLDDTLKASNLYDLGFSLRVEDPMMAFECAKQVYKCSKKIQSKKYEAKAYNLLGILNYRNKNFHKALEYHTLALQIREALHNDLETGRSYTNLGNVYSDLESYELSEKYHLKALTIFLKHQDKKQILNSLCNLGVLKHAQKQDTPAVRNFIQALTLAEQINDYESRAMCCNNLGLIYEESENWEMAMNYYFENVKLNEQMGSHGTLAKSYFNVGSVYVGMKEFDKAQPWLNRALKVAEQYGQVDELLIIREKLANIYADKGDFKLAYEFLNQNNLISVNGGSDEIENYMLFTLPSDEGQFGTPSILWPGQIIYFLLGILTTIIVLITFGKFKNKK